MLKPIDDERGVALPLAMVSLVVLTGMMVAFAVLARSEPMIAANQMQTAQALRLADSGLQVAMWALSNPTHASGLDPVTMPHTGAVVAGRYDGTQVISAGTLGAFTVRVTWEPGNGTYERTVTAVGWLPTQDGNFVNSHRKIQAIVQQGYTPPLDPPCVLCVAGEVQVNGTAAAFNSAIGACPGKTAPTTATQTLVDVGVTGHPTFIGYGTTGDAARGISSDTSQFKYTADSLSKFKEYAKSQGTYYQGTKTNLPSGPGPFVVFIDTVDGSEFTPSTSTSNEGRLDLAGGGIFNGTVIVAGTVNMSGNNTINGLVYSLNDLNISGNVTVSGGVISENRRDASSTSIDTDISGNVTMTYDCSKIRNLPWSYRWVVKTGGYLEQAGY
jgi:hypothetical protein